MIPIRHYWHDMKRETRRTIIAYGITIAIFGCYAILSFIFGKFLFEGRMDYGAALTFFIYLGILFFISIAELIKTVFLW